MRDAVWNGMLVQAEGASAEYQTKICAKYNNISDVLEKSRLTDISDELFSFDYADLCFTMTRL